MANSNKISAENEGDADMELETSSPSLDSSISLSTDGTTAPRIPAPPLELSSRVTELSRLEGKIAASSRKIRSRQTQIKTLERMLIAEKAKLQTEKAAHQTLVKQLEARKLVKTEDDSIVPLLELSLGEPRASKSAPIPVDRAPPQPAPTSVRTTNLANATATSSCASSGTSAPSPPTTMQDELEEGELPDADMNSSGPTSRESETVIVPTVIIPRTGTETEPWQHRDGSVIRSTTRTETNPIEVHTNVFDKGALKLVSKTSSPSPGVKSLSDRDKRAAEERERNLKAAEERERMRREREERERRDREERDRREKVERDRKDQDERERRERDERNRRERSREDRSGPSTTGRAPVPRSGESNPRTAHDQTSNKANGHGSQTLRDATKGVQAGPINNPLKKLRLDEARNGPTTTPVLPTQRIVHTDDKVPTTTPTVPSAPATQTDILRKLLLQKQANLSQTEHVSGKRKREDDSPAPSVRSAHPPPGVSTEYTPSTGGPISIDGGGFRRSPPQVSDGS
ncbi:hypothetical protein M427DRAFT_54198 [Gonapodya prolifera JEL478]|uniref:Uncharacterized protein n=1 Tax=Gonapodya prolifera (strain JEL478) TaxID=1344416 RepID=A0A139AMK4_GONPJ|nr:hypothetical protein M427DRAFT_54198 [Gonapodya prolifera JEL478]|eukprot:KXS17979.1 hypothetical protein M427DRAFT_54198 [Gonapodya prolifera JEL478]